MIAHRLNTIVHADRILVMKEGQVIEEGGHTTLLQKAGLYREMVGAYGAGLVT
jgi:ABC-type transport system involved in Fe-S cluster assembly fused permease/ATPase subunit